MAAGAATMGTRNRCLLRSVFTQRPAGTEGPKGAWPGSGAFSEVVAAFMGVWSGEPWLRPNRRPPASRLSRLGRAQLEAQGSARNRLGGQNVPRRHVVEPVLRLDGLASRVVSPVGSNEPEDLPMLSRAAMTALARGCQRGRRSWA